MPDTDTPIEQHLKTLGRYAVGDRFFWQGHSGEVTKLGRKWVTVHWEHFDGYSWDKQHLPEMLDGMRLDVGDIQHTPWEPVR